MQEDDSELAMGNHHHSHHNHQHQSIKCATIAGMTIFSLGYMISEPNLDGFNLEEALEYITNEHLESIPVHVAGFVTSFISNVPLLSAIIYCWMNEKVHNHSKLQEVIELIGIGGPFALMGSAAYLDSLGELIDVANLTLLQKVFAYSGSVIAGSITGFGAYKLHGFHAHAGSEEHGGGITGFSKSLYTTFIRNVWRAKEEHHSITMKVLAVLNEIWKKYGILAMHGFLGYFAADVFLEQTGIQNQALVFEMMFKILLPIAIMLYEGNTEARSLDSYRRRQGNEPLSYSLYSKLVVILSGMFHTIPSMTGLALVMGKFDNGPGEGKLYNSLAFMTAGLLLAYPSIYGFVATTINGFDKAAKGLGKKLEVCTGNSHQPDHQSIDNRSQESTCSKVLSLFGFFREPEKENLNLLIFGNDDKRVRSTGLRN